MLGRENEVNCLKVKYLQTTPLWTNTPHKNYHGTIILKNSAFCQLSTKNLKELPNNSKQTQISSCPKVVEFMILRTIYANSKHNFLPKYSQ